MGCGCTKATVAPANVVFESPPAPEQDAKTQQEDNPSVVATSQPDPVENKAESNLKEVEAERPVEVVENQAESDIKEAPSEQRGEDRVEFTDSDGDLVAFVKTPDNKLQKWVNGNFNKDITSLSYKQSDGDLRDQDGWGCNLPELDRDVLMTRLTKLAEQCGVGGLQKPADDDTEIEPYVRDPNAPLLVMDGEYIRRQSDTTKKLFADILESNDLKGQLKKKDFLQYFRNQGVTSLTSRRLYSTFNPKGTNPLTFDEFHQNVLANTYKVGEEIKQ